MEERDQQLKRRIRDIIAVVTPDIDAVMFDVEDGIAYIEGVVSTQEQRTQISNALRQLDGLTHAVICLSTEHIMRVCTARQNRELNATPALVRYHSLS